VVNLLDEFLAAGTSSLVLGGGPTKIMPNFLDSALDLLGDVFDPFVPGGAGSERRLTADTASTGQAAIARARARIEGGTGRRPRRRKALTAEDMRTMLIIANTISKKAAETFVLTRVRNS